MPSFPDFRDCDESNVFRSRRRKSLQQICVGTIAKCVDRFGACYDTTEDEDVRRRFHILRKLYSHELVSMLYYKEQDLREEHADFVFSQGMRRMRTKWVSHFSWEAVVGIFIRIGSNFEEVFFDRDRSRTDDRPWEDVICHLSNVKVISYEDSCKNGILKCISESCPRLETLDLENSPQVTDVGLKYFCPVEKKLKHKRKGRRGRRGTQKVTLPCPLLKNIFLKGTTVHDDGMQHMLKNLRSLEYIDYEMLSIVLYKMHATDLGSLDEVEKYNLKKFDFKLPILRYPAFYCDVLKMCATLCPNLKSVTCPIWKLEHSNLFSSVPVAEELHLVGDEEGIDIGDFLRKRGENVKQLYLDRLNVSLTALGLGCPHLSTLSLREVKIEYDEKECIPVFGNLKELFIRRSSSDFDDSKEICRILISSPGLQVLDFWNRTFTSELKTAILLCCAQNPMRVIFFCDIDVDMEFMKDILKTCSTLETLSLDYYDFYDKRLEELCKFASTLPNRPDITWD